MKLAKLSSIHGFASTRTQFFVNPNLPDFLDLIGLILGNAFHDFCNGFFLCLATKNLKFENIH